MIEDKVIERRLRKTDMGDEVARVIKKVENCANFARINGLTQPVNLELTIPELRALAALSAQLAEARAALQQVHEDIVDGSGIYPETKTAVRDALAQSVAEQPSVTT